MKVFLNLYLMGKKHKGTLYSEPCLELVLFTVQFEDRQGTGTNSTALPTGSVTPPRTIERIGTATPPYVHIRRLELGLPESQSLPKRKGAGCKR